jgi:hypothetical protein
MRSERQTQIVLLERTLTDFDYQPPTWTGALVQRQAKAGEGPSERVPCPDCGGEGERRIRGIPTLCARCKGSGLVTVDAYTQREVGSEEGGLVDRRGWVRCDSCGGGAFGRAPGVHGNGQACRHCADSGRPGWVRAPEQKARPWRDRAPLSAAADTFAAGDPVLACMERRVLAGSYEELGLALAALRLERGRLYRLNVGVFVEANREEDELDRYEALLVEEGLAYLASLMPREIRVPSWAATYEQRRREQVLSKREVAA